MLYLNSFLSNPSLIKLNLTLTNVVFELIVGIHVQLLWINLTLTNVVFESVVKSFLNLFNFNKCCI